MSSQDQLRGFIIQELMTNMMLDINEVEELFEIDFRAEFTSEIQQLQSFVEDGLLTITGNKIEVQPHARLFVRNICAAFDEYLQRHAFKEEQQVEWFSKVA